MPPKIIVVEAFYGGSHKTLIDVLMENLVDSTFVTLPAKKWHWRARCGALMMFDLIPRITTEKFFFCSSVLNLSELLGLRPDLQPLKKIVYFHENQLVYPVRVIKERDIQYSYNQILTCLTADVILFNSEFNKNSFLDNIKKLTKILPDFKPKNLESRIETKCQVLYFPIKYPQVLPCIKSNILHVVWPHRWEFDKGPEDFFNTLFRLKREGIPFRVSVLGEKFIETPPIFSSAENTLRNEILHFGYVESKSDYYEILSSSHVVVSTAKHEFFGVAMLEAVYCGCYPLAPRSLVYIELYEEDCLFSDTEDLYEKLKRMCLDPSSANTARERLCIDFNKYSDTTFVSNFLDLMQN